MVRSRGGLFSAVDSCGLMMMMMITLRWEMVFCGLDQSHYICNENNRILNLVFSNIPQSVKVNI